MLSARDGPAHLRFPDSQIDGHSFGTGDQLAVFDVWDSRQSFDRFGQTLMPVLKEIGVDPGEPQVMPIHNVIKG